jgi:hypothetical protein
MSYDASKTAKKAAGGGIDGVIAGGITAIVAPIVIATAKKLLPDLDDETCAAVAGTVAVGVAAVVVSVKRALLNFLKHRKDK